MTTAYVIAGILILLGTVAITLSPGWGPSPDLRATVAAGQLRRVGRHLQAVTPAMFAIGAAATKAAEEFRQAMNRWEISVGPAGRGRIEVNGEDISDRVMGVRVETMIGEATTVTATYVDCEVEFEVEEEGLSERPRRPCITRGAGARE